MSEEDIDDSDSDESSSDDEEEDDVKDPNRNRGNSTKIILPPPPKKKVDKSFSLPELKDPIFDSLKGKDGMSSGENMALSKPPLPMFGQQKVFQDFQFRDSFSHDEVKKRESTKKVGNDPKSDDCVTPSDPDLFYQHHFNIPPPDNLLNSSSFQNNDGDAKSKGNPSDLQQKVRKPPPTNAVFPNVFSGSINLPGLESIPNEAPNFFNDDDDDDDHNNNNPFFLDTPMFETVENKKVKSNQKKKKKKSPIRSSKSEFSDSGSGDEENDVFQSDDTNNVMDVPVGVFWDVENINFFRIDTGRRREYFSNDNSAMMMKKKKEKEGIITLKDQHRMYLGRLKSFCERYGVIREFKAFIDTGRNDLETRYIIPSHCRKMGINIFNVATYSRGKVIKEAVDCILLMDIVNWAYKTIGEKKKKKKKKKGNQKNKNISGVVVLISADSDFFKVIKVLKDLNFMVIVVADENQKLLISQVKLVDEMKTIGEIMDPLNTSMRM